MREGNAFAIFADGLENWIGRVRGFRNDCCLIILLLMFPSFLGDGDQYFDGESDAITPLIVPVTFSLFPMIDL